MWNLWISKSIFSLAICNKKQFGKAYVICDPFGLTKWNSNKILIYLEPWLVVFVLEPAWYELWVFGYVCFGTSLNERWEYIDHFQACYQEPPLCKLPSCWYMLIHNFSLELKSMNCFTINSGATLFYTIIPFRFV